MSPRPYRLGRREASVEEIAAVPGLGPDRATQILDHLGREAQMPAPGTGRLVLKELRRAGQPRDQNSPAPLRGG